MNRRKFVRLSSASVLGIVTGCQPQEYNRWETNPFDLQLHSDMEIGHLVFGMKDFSVTKKIRKETLIVGAGMAGLSAAWKLKDQDYVLCELSDRIGGSAACEQYQNTLFPQGAHYDLDYPSYFGQEALQMLEGLGTVQFDSVTDLWRFSERKYIVDYKYETQALYNSEYWDDVIPSEGAEFERFMELTERYLGKLKLPTRLIDPELRALDQETFLDFLNRKMPLSARFARGVDYQMIDDFGANSQVVSALAGLFYYAGRSYRGEDTETFSPPEGNAYFARKLENELNPEGIKLRHLVRKITPTKNTIKAEVIDIKNNEVIEYEVNNVVYAGQKHALKFVYPQDYPLFKGNVYAPWMVLSFVLDNNTLERGYWQNEILSMERNFLGFIDSDAQYGSKEHRVLTAYYCLPNWDREQLANIQQNAQRIAHQTVENICSFFQIQPSVFKKNLKKVFLKVMGHAMPIPIPHYLFKDKNPSRSHKNMVYAGTDNSRLPLLLEAIDSGLEAADLILENS